ncbi:MAG: hypothetical protein Q8R02_02325 [Hyphomonadaceae bacterium]|nr:hypothetical protein [Hyphomonadaceae bacterium]
MGAVLGIGPVSVRYAAQIREMLYSQAVKKMVAEQEAARAEAAAERTARLEAIQARNEAFAPEEPVKVDAQTAAKAAERAELAEPVSQPEAKESAPVKAAPVPAAQIFDEMA